MVRYRQRPTRFSTANERLRIRLRELAEQRRRWGYRRLHVLLEREGWVVNSKRVYRIYVEEKLVVRRRKRRRRIRAQARVLLPRQRAATRLGRWIFCKMLWLRAGRYGRCRSKMLTRGSCWPSRSILRCLRVVRVLERLRVERGLPLRIVIDNGTEFTSKALDQWTYENTIVLHFITPSRPMENG